MAGKFTLKLLQAKGLTNNVREFIFTPDNPPSFKAGQFISLHIEKDGKDNRRNYSVTNSPAQDNIISIAISYVPNGLASTLLWNLEPGDIVNASGPYGIFVLENMPPKRYILIGTGTGIAPYRSMLPEIKEFLTVNPHHEIVVIEGVRTKADLLYGADFSQLAIELPNFKFLACYSQEKNHLESYERLGYIQKNLNELNLQPGHDLVYLCGNPQMVDDLFTLLQEWGFDKKAIKREKYVIAR